MILCHMMRVSKLMSLRGICSRREAERFIEEGLVRVNGILISEQGVKVSEDAHVELLDKAKEAQNDKVTLILNKPIGYVSCQPEKGYKPAITLIKPENQFGKELKLKPHHFEKLAVCGRLDIDSQGLLLFTQDGRLVKEIIGPESHVEKEYLVRVEGFVTKEQVQKLSWGLSLDGKRLKPAKVTLIDPHYFNIVLTEGKKRQIRRMCDEVGLKVISLKRVRIGSFRLGKLPLGQWRSLSI